MTHQERLNPFEIRAGVRTGPRRRHRGAQCLNPFEIRAGVRTEVPRWDGGEVRVLIPLRSGQVFGRESSAVPFSANTS